MKIVETITRSYVKLNKIKIHSMSHYLEKCFLCGATNNLTNDHIPPKNLFKPPLPKNLITVKSYKKCNGSYSKDEEYFRFAVLTPAYKDDNGRWVWDNKVINSTLKRSPKLKREIFATIKKRDAISTTGELVLDADTILIDSTRLRSVVNKITRGLITHHIPRLELDTVIFKSDMLMYDDAMRLYLFHLPSISIGNNTFTYWFQLDKNEPRISTWFLSFYNTTLFTTGTELY